MSRTSRATLIEPHHASLGGLKAPHVVVGLLLDESQRAGGKPEDNGEDEDGNHH